MKKRIIICLDGTWNNAASEHDVYEDDKVYKPTNVLKTCRAVLATAGTGENPLEQITYYDIGVGGLRKFPGKSNKYHRISDKLHGGSTGAGYEGNVEDAYRFLTSNYEQGDDIFIFGFSRGASQARTLTRLIDWMGGVLSKSEDYWLPRFFDAFLENKNSYQETWVAALSDTMKLQSHKHSNWGQPAIQKLAEKILGRANGLDHMVNRATVQYLGIWDTVSALIDSRDHYFVGATPAAVVENVRHALAIDEKRDLFVPRVFTSRAPNNPNQILEQKWFPGVHSNVGGGYVNDGLANHAFKWVLDGAVQQGLQINKEYIGHFRGYAQDTLYKSKTAKWAFIDKFIKNKGKRYLDPTKSGVDPQKAKLGIHYSAFERLGTADFNKHKEMDAPYQPEHLLDYLVSFGSALDEFLLNQLPDDTDRDESEIDTPGLRKEIKRVVASHRK